MGLAQQFLAGRSPHRVLVGDEPLDTRFSEALERAVTARAKNEFGLVENAMAEQGALARTQNAYRQQRQAKLEEAQYKEAVDQAAVKAAATDAILGDIFQTKQERLNRTLENMDKLNKAETNDVINDALKREIFKEELREQTMNIETVDDYQRVKELFEQYKSDSNKSDSIKINTDQNTSN